MSYSESKIIAPDCCDSYDYFGTSVALNDEFAIVGSDGDDEPFFRQGSVYIYKRDKNFNTWNFTQKLSASDATSWDYFGASVAIHKNYTIVGADGADKAYIFKLNDTDGVWYEISILTAPHGTYGTYSGLFGYSVDIMDTFAVVGDPYNKDIDFNFGAAYVFMKTVTDWKEDWIYVSTIYPSDAKEYTTFAQSISMCSSGMLDYGYNNGFPAIEYAVIGAYYYYYHSDANVGSGSAYILEMIAWNSTNVT